MKRLLLVLGTVIYIVAFLWGYVEVVVPFFSSTGFTFHWPGWPVIGWATFLSLIPLTILPIRLRKPSILILWWLYITAYVPSMLMPVVTIAIPDRTLMPLQIWVLGTMLLLCLVPHAKTLVLPQISISPSLFWWIVGLSWAACLVFSLATISPSQVLANFALLISGESEYLIRSDFENQAGQSGIPIGYIVRLLSQALDPFLMAYGLLSRRWWLLVAGIFGQIVYFGQVGMKEVVASTFLIVVVYLMLKRPLHSFGLVLLAGATGIVVVSTVVDSATNTALLSTQFTRRSIAGPGQLTGFYFEHYSTAPHPGHNFTGSGSFDRYGPPREIGLYYFGSANVDANASFWAEGFAEYGIPGIVGFALVLASMLWIYDSIAARRSLLLAVLLSITVADALANSSPLTVLVTHGGVAIGLLLYFAPHPQLHSVTPRLWGSLRRSPLSGLRGSRLHSIARSTSLYN